MSVEKKRYELIGKICDRANKNFAVKDRLSLFMDIDTAQQDCKLNLNILLDFNDENFNHDIVGISNNLNRETKKLDNCFLPRSV